VRLTLIRGRRDRSSALACRPLDRVVLQVSNADKFVAERLSCVLRLPSRKAGDELNLTKKIISLHPSNLPLPDHVDCFVALNRSPSRLEFSEALLGVNSTFDGSMILFENVVQVLYRSVSTAVAQRPFLLTVWFWLGLSCEHPCTIRDRAQLQHRPDDVPARRAPRTGTTGPTFRKGWSELPVRFRFEQVRRGRIEITENAAFRALVAGPGKLFGSDYFRIGHDPPVICDLIFNLSG
jgi:hypothetical protein